MIVPTGISIGKTRVAPAMDELNTKENIKAFAAKFRSWYGDDKQRALAEYKFGSIAAHDALPFDGKDQKAHYIRDANAVGDHVKQLCVEALVGNYFSDDPMPMEFQIGGTDVAGGDLLVGPVKKASTRETVLLFRILCQVTPK